VCVCMCVLCALWCVLCYKIMWAPAGHAFINIGIAWHLGEYRGLQTVYHGGSDVGFKSYILLIPEKSIGVVAISNFSKTPIKDIVMATLDVLFGNEPKN